MEFCPECNSILLPKKGILKCSTCGYTEKLEEESIEQYTMKGDKKEEQEVVVIDNEVVTMPTTKGTCYRCGNTKIAWWMMQTRSADEAPTVFYRCIKCGNTWKGHD